MPVVTERILAEVPDALMAMMREGTAERVGMVVRDTASKQILGHLQETGATQALVGRVLEGGGSALANSAGGLLSGGGLGSVATVIQNEQIKGKLDVLTTMMGGMQTMQIATLVTSVAGIGVTAASTALILHRLRRIEGRMDALIDRLDAQDRRDEDRDLRKVLSRVEDQLDRLSQANVSRRDPTSIVERAEEELQGAFSGLRDSAKEILARPSVAAEDVESVLSGIALCGTAQIKALFWLDEKDRASFCARNQSTAMRDIAMQIPEDRLAGMLGDNADLAPLLFGAFSEVRMRAASVPTLARALEDAEVHGRDYIMRAQDEIVEPLLLMPARP